MSSKPQVEVVIVGVGLVVQLQLCQKHCGPG